MRPSLGRLGILLSVFGLTVGCEKASDRDSAPLPSDIKMVASEGSLPETSRAYPFKLFYQGSIAEVRFCESTKINASCEEASWKEEDRPSPISYRHNFKESGQRILMVEARFESGAVQLDHISVNVMVAQDGGAGVPGGEGGQPDSAETSQPDGAETGGVQTGSETGGAPSTGDAQPNGEEGSVGDGQATSTSHGNGHQPDGTISSDEGTGEAQAEMTDPEIPGPTYALEIDGQGLNFAQDRYYSASAEGIDFIVKLPDGVSLQTSQLKVAGKTIILCGDQACRGEGDGALKFRVPPQDLVANGISELKFTYTIAGDDQKEFTKSLFLFYDAESPQAPNVTEFSLRDVEEGTKITWEATQVAESKDQIHKILFKVCPENQSCGACDSQVASVNYAARQWVLPRPDDEVSTQICVASEEFSGHRSEFNKLGYSSRIFGEELADDSFLNRAQFFSKGQGLPLMQDFILSHNEGVGQGQMSGVRVLPDFAGQALKIFAGLYEPPQLANINGATRWTYLDRPESQAYSIKGVCPQSTCQVKLDPSHIKEDHTFLLVGFNMRFRGLTQTPREIKIQEDGGTLHLSLASDDQDSFYYHIAYSLLPTYLIKPDSIQDKEVHVDGLGSFARAQDFQVGSDLIRGFHLTIQSSNDRLQSKGHVARATLVPMMGTSHPKTHQGVADALTFNEVSPKAPKNVQWGSSVGYGAVRVDGAVADPRKQKLMFLACEREDCRCGGEPILFSEFGQTFLPPTDHGAVNACVATAYDEDGMNVSTFTRSPGQFHGPFLPSARLEGKRDVVLENLAPSAGGIKSMTVAFCSQADCGVPCYDRQNFTTQDLLQGQIRKAMRVKGAQHGKPLYVCVRAKDQQSQDLGWNAIKDITLEREVCVYEHANYKGWRECSNTIGHRFTRKNISSVEITGNVCARLYRRWTTSQPPKTHTINRVIEDSTHYVGKQENDRLEYVELVTCS